MNALRSLARGVAKNRMKQKGMKQICKRQHNHKGEKDESKFSRNWRKEVWT